MNKNNLLSVIAVILSVVALVAVFTVKGTIRLGGTTADNWNVGGNLAVTGTGTITGALTQTGAATLASTLSVTGTSTLATSTIGDSGTAITKYLSAVGSAVDMANLVAQACTSTAVTLTGLATSSDWIVFASPNPGTNGFDSIKTSLSYFAFASTTAADVVQINVCNNSTTTAVNLGSQTWRVGAIRH